MLKYSFRTYVKALTRSHIGAIFDLLFLGNESQNRMSDTNFRTFLLDLGVYFNSTCNLSSKKECFNGTVLDLYILGEINWSNGTFWEE